MPGPDGQPPLCADLRPNDPRRWSAYPVGCVTSLIRHHPELKSRMTGWDILLESHVPGGAGVSSSAALEMATLRALTQSVGMGMDGLEAARLGQWAENKVAGAPCGIMDQVTSALGRRGDLLALLCQPCRVLGYHSLPDGSAIAGLNSNIKHSVGGSRYTAARVGAFMGLALLREWGARAAGGAPLEYLCQISAEEFRREWQGRLPARMKGSEWSGSYPDPVTRIDANMNYAVRSATAHPVYERRRVERFLQARERAAEATGAERERWLRRAGQQMYWSDWSYRSRVRLGCRETTLLVRLLKEAGVEAGIYGARITGGGSGGTVAVLHREDAAGRLDEIARVYQAQTGLAAQLLQGSSPGAWEGADGSGGNR